MPPVVLIYTVEGGRSRWDAVGTRDVVTAKGVHVLPEVAVPSKCSHLIISSSEPVVAQIYAPISNAVVNFRLQCVGVGIGCAINHNSEILIRHRAGATAACADDALHHRVVYRVETCKYRPSVRPHAFIGKARD